MTSAAPPVSVTQLVEQMAASDPTLGAVLQLMRQQDAARSAPGDHGLAGSSRAEISRLERRYARLRDAYDSLLELNGRLARALGACPRCWGESDACPRCGGNGRPGAAVADPVLFRELIAPALHRLEAAAANGTPEAEG